MTISIQIVYKVDNGEIMVSVHQGASFIEKLGGDNLD